MSLALDALALATVVALDERGRASRLPTREAREAAECAAWRVVELVRPALAVANDAERFRRLALAEARPEAGAIAQRFASRLSTRKRGAR